MLFTKLFYYETNNLKFHLGKGFEWENKWFLNGVKVVIW